MSTWRRARGGNTTRENGDMDWRERIEQARARGEFTQEDRDAIGAFHTCMVGEAAQRVLGKGMYDHDFLFHPLRDRLIELGYDEEIPGHRPIRAITGNHFDEAERCLERIEAEALKIKREI